MSSSLSFLLAILAMTLLSLADANIFQTVEDGFNKVEGKVKAVLGHIPEAASIRRWAHLSPAVKHMAVDVPLTLISQQANKKKIQSSFTSGFSWASCGPSNQLVEIRNLTINPSPLYFPGKLSFGFYIIFHDTISVHATVTADLVLQYSAGTGTWFKIPCVGQIGSCHYADVCSLSEAIVCPDELKQRGIPCTCPMNKGEYELPNFTVEVDAAIFLAGEYRAKATFTDSVKGQIACYQVTFTIG